MPDKSCFENGKYFWVIVSLIYTAVVFWLGSAYLFSKNFWYGYVASIGCIFIIKSVVNGDDINLSFYTIKKSDRAVNKFSRLFFCLVAIFIVLFFSISFKV